MKRSKHGPLQKLNVRVALSGNKQLQGVAKNTDESRMRFFETMYSLMVIYSAFYW